MDKILYTKNILIFFYIQKIKDWLNRYWRKRALKGWRLPWEGYVMTNFIVNIPNSLANQISPITGENRTVYFLIIYYEIPEETMIERK